MRVLPDLTETVDIQVVYVALIVFFYVLANKLNAHVVQTQYTVLHIEVDGFGM